MKNMVALIGEQPIPNLLPIRYDKPEAVLLVRTVRTKPVSERLKKVVQTDTLVEFCDISDQCDPAITYRQIKNDLQRLGWLPTEIVFNVTGGTKPMAFAAYHLALDQHSEFLYLESEEKKSRLRQYKFEQGLEILTRNEIIPGIITIDEYLLAHLPGFREDGFSQENGQLTSGGLFEECLYNTLNGKVDEIKAGIRPDGVKEQLEIDLVIRCGNQVGIIEAKTGGMDKKGIDQLTNVGGREYLGTYTVKFWVTGRQVRRELKTLAMARGITVIELPGYIQGKPLSQQEKTRLIQIIREKLT